MSYNSGDKVIILIDVLELNPDKSIYSTWARAGNICHVSKSYKSNWLLVRCWETNKLFQVKNTPDFITPYTTALAHSAILTEILQQQNMEVLDDMSLSEEAEQIDEQVQQIDEQVQQIDEHLLLETQQENKALKDQLHKAQQLILEMQAVAADEVTAKIGWDAAYASLYSRYLAATDKDLPVQAAIKLQASARRMLARLLSSNVKSALEMYSGEGDGAAAVKDLPVQAAIKLQAHVRRMLVPRARDVVEGLRGERRPPPGQNFR